MFPATDSVMVTPEEKSTVTPDGMRSLNTRSLASAVEAPVCSMTMFHVMASPESTLVVALVRVLLTVTSGSTISTSSKSESIWAPMSLS